MNSKLKAISLWSARLLWPSLVLMMWWSARIETGLAYRLLCVFLVIASIMFAWWQKRLYLAAVSLVFIGVSGLFVYLLNAGADGFNLIASYTVLVFILTVACFSAFLTYALKVNKPDILVYLTGVIFLCLEFFWLLSSLAADPIVRGLLVTGLFHITFTMVALDSWKNLSKPSFRWYLVVSAIFFAIFIQLM